MENKINIAELLKDCPTGMELDCTIWDNIVFEEIDENNIVISRKSVDSKVYLTQYGELNSIDGKCVIFPKGKTTWEGFYRLFKDGDIAISSFGNIHILKNHNTSYIHVDFTHSSKGLFCKTLTNCVNTIRLATEEEKQKLFDAIKANGYCWNAESKTLEKLVEPKFTVGDTIKNKNDKWQAKRTIRSYVAGIGYFTTINDCIRLEDQDNWELVIEPIFKVGDRIRHKEKTTWACTIARVKDKYYVDEHPTSFTLPFSEQDDYELVPNKFDITTLKHFDRILCRQDEYSFWMPSLFGFYNEDATRNPFICSNGFAYKYCIPYEHNEHLLGTTNDCNDFYKTWEK